MTDRENTVDEVPPLSLEGRLAFGGALVCLVLLLVPVVRAPRAMILLAPLVVYFAALTVGLWRLRPSPGHPIAYAFSTGYCLLKVAVYLLTLWPLAGAVAVGEAPVFAPGQGAVAQIAVLFFALSWIPLFFAHDRCRRSAWLMWAAGRS